MTPQIVIVTAAIYYATAAIEYTVEAVVIAIMSVVGIATAFTPLAQRTAAEVDEIIGAEATPLSLRSYRWKVGMWVSGLLLLVLVPLGTWAQVGRSHILLLPAVIAGVATVWCAWQNVRLGGKVDRAASAYVSERVGYELTISQPLGFSRKRWERSVARAEQQRQSVLDALQRGGTEFALRKELARRRRSELVGYPISVVVGACLGLILGMIVALPAWKVLAEPSVAIGALVGAFGLPIWSYIGNRRASSKFKAQVLKRLSEIQSSPVK